MFGSRSVVEMGTRSDARHQAEVRSWWRDWHRYLQAQLQILRARAAEGTLPPSFERSEDAWEQQRADAEQTLRRIPQERRALFDRTREAHRVGVVADMERANGSAAAALDPDAVERQTLEQLLRKAEGADDEGWGEVPLPNQLYQLDVAALLRAPRAADYLAAADDGAEQRKRLMLIAALLVVGVVIVWLTWPRGSSAVAPPSASPMLVGGTAAKPWPIHAVVVEHAGGRTTLAVTATDGVAWPALARDEHGAWWRSTTIYPLRLCLPSSLLRTATALEVRSDGVPVRRYTSTADTDGQADLVVDDCGTTSTSAARRWKLAAAAPPLDESPQQPVQLGPDKPSLRIDEVVVRSAADDGSLPPESYRVMVRVTASSPVDWVALAPRLVLQSGATLLPSDPVTTKRGGAEVTYLAPAWTTPVDAAWIVSDTGDTASHRWRLRLDPPPSRAARLRDVLRVTVRGRRDTSSSDATVMVTLRNTGASTLTVEAADLVFVQHDQPIAVDTSTADGVAIASGGTRTLTFAVPELDPLAPLEVWLGGLCFRLEFGEGGVTDEGEQP